MDRESPRDSDLPERPNTARLLQLSSAQVLFRFGLRTVILCTFSAFGTHGFATTLTTLLAFAVVLCICIGLIRREAAFGHVLTHWDEAAAYALMIGVIAAVAA